MLPASCSLGILPKVCVLPFSEAVGPPPGNSAKQRMKAASLPLFPHGSGFRPFPWVPLVPWNGGTQRAGGTIWPQAYSFCPCLSPQRYVSSPNSTPAHPGHACQALGPGRFLCKAACVCARVCVRVTGMRPSLVPRISQVVERCPHDSEGGLSRQASEMRPEGQGALKEVVISVRLREDLQIWHWAGEA